MSLIGETKLNILLALQEEPSHYALAEMVGRSTGGIYVHLQELEEEGMIEVHEEDEDRTLYRLTDNGELLLKALGEGKEK